MKHITTLQIEKKKADNRRLYKVLGLEPTASLDAIKKAYKELAKKAQGNKQRLAELEEAFEVLSNKEKREAYDKRGEASLKGEQGQESDEEGEEPDIQNLFDMLRGQKSKKPSKPRRPKLKPMQFALEATLDEIYTGATSKMKVNRMRLCKACGGKGCKPGAYSTTCQTCEGRKVVMKLVQMGPGMYAQSRAPCEDCHGTGDIMSEEDRCKVCKGEKIQEDQKELEVKLDPGVPDNHVYNFPGEGNEVVMQGSFS